jgi:hypothetical protein
LRLGKPLISIKSFMNGIPPTQDRFLEGLAPSGPRIKEKLFKPK